MNTVISDEMIGLVSEKGIFGVLEIEDLEDAVPVAETLLDNGISAIELALRTNAAVPAIREIHRVFPEMFITAGTVIFPDQIQDVIDAGASMAVAPGFNPGVVEKAIELKFPFAPGISTASEVEAAYAMGCRLLKLFPAEPLGGIRYMKSMMGPYSYLGLKLFPLGGLNEDNLASWASEPNVVALGGSWIAPKGLIREKDFKEIGKRAKKASACWKKVKEETR